MTSVVMPYDPKVKQKKAGILVEKWPFLLKCFGQKTPLGWSQTAKLIKETNPRHNWNLTGLEHYTTNHRLKCDPSLSIFEHIQTVFEDSKKTLRSVCPIAYLTSPKSPKKITEDSRIFSAEQVEALLVMAFFCTFPYRNSDGEMPGINFNTLYEAMSRGSKRHEAAKAKMDCIWQYFASRAYQERNKGQERKIEFKRRSMRDFPSWNGSKKALTSIAFSSRPMEDQDGPILEVDFANKVIGGGILGSGSVQEEIRMAIAPEMIVARLFTAPLEDNEVLFIKGAKRFSRTSGYSNSLKFEEHYIDIEMREVVAMDAREYRDRSQQFKRKEIERELNKAFCAFYSKSRDKTKIATGHWGCGAFGGDKELKAILQLLAASEAERDIIYCMPGADFPKQFQKTVDILHRAGATIGQVFRAVDEFDHDRGSSLFAWLQRYKFLSRREEAKKMEEEKQATNPVEKSVKENAESEVKKQSTSTSNQKHDALERQNMPTSGEKEKQCQPTEKFYDPKKYENKPKEEDLMTFSEQTNKKEKENENKQEQEENELYQTNQTNVNEQGMSYAGKRNSVSKDVVIMPFDQEGTWPRKLKTFGKRNPLWTEFGVYPLVAVAELLQKNKQIKLGLKKYMPSPYIEMNSVGHEIMGHIQEVFEKSKETLLPVTPIRFLSSRKETDEQTVMICAEQAETLLVMAFFCTFPDRNYDGDMPGMNFYSLYEAVDQYGYITDEVKIKMDCIWQYFASSAYAKIMGKKIGWTERKIEFNRRSMGDFPSWDYSKKNLTLVTFSDLPIEDQTGPVTEVNFTKKIIGGGILGSETNQEEIKMLLAPEMIVARLFTAPLEDNEVLFINGAKRFSKNPTLTGYKKFNGPYIDMKKREVVAIDAREYSDPMKQFKRKEIERELNKAYCAFYSKSENKTKIATGHSGRGDKELKAILQLLAASEAEREIVFCMPEPDFQKKFQKTVDILNTARLTIREVLRAVNEFNRDRGPSLFIWLESKFEKKA